MYVPLKLQIESGDIGFQFPLIHLPPHLCHLWDVLASIVATPGRESDPNMCTQIQDGSYGILAWENGL